MNLKRLLTEGDPVAREPELASLHAQSTRQRMLVEARTQPQEPSTWWRPRPLAIAAVLIACLGLAVGIGLRDDNVNRPAPAVRPSDSGTRQLQFATPGGTRIMWTFHQELDL